MRIIFIARKLRVLKYGTKPNTGANYWFKNLSIKRKITRTPTAYRPHPPLPFEQRVKGSIDVTLSYHLGATFICGFHGILSYYLGATFICSFHGAVSYGLLIYILYNNCTKPKCALVRCYFCGDNCLHGILILPGMVMVCFLLLLLISLL